MAFLSVQNLQYLNPGKTPVSDISFTLEVSDRMAIAGETGSGKTSLVKMIAGLLQPHKGQVLFKGSRVLGPDEQLIAGNKKIAYLSQHFELRNNYRVIELLNMVNEMEPEEAMEIYKICRIDHLVNRWTRELSGGEKQRISLAKLLITQPQLLILDEPFSNLDVINKMLMKEVIDDYLKSYKVGCIMVSHHAEEVLSWANKLGILHNGKLVQFASVKEVFYKPINTQVAGLLGAYSLIDASLLPEPTTAFPFHKINNKYLIRPSQINFTNQENAILKGHVERIQFFGNYYLYNVKVQQQIMQVSQLHAFYNLGDEVFLNFI